MVHQANPCHVEGQCVCMSMDLFVTTPGYVTQAMIAKRMWHNAVKTCLFGCRFGFCN